MREQEIERHLVKRVKELGGEIRKVSWGSRSFAPDRVVMLKARRLTNTLDCAWCNPQGQTIWVEVKNPDTIKTFPATPRERAQHREHERLRAMGQRVEVVGTIEGVERLLG